MSIFTKKTGGDIWSTWYLSHYSITPGRYFSYWTDLLVKILGVNRCHLRDYLIQDQTIFCSECIKKLVMNGPFFNSLKVVNPWAVMIQNTVMEMDSRALFGLGHDSPNKLASRTFKVAPESGICNVALEIVKFFEIFGVSHNRHIIGCWTK